MGDNFYWKLKHRTQSVKTKNSYSDYKIAKVCVQVPYKSITMSFQVKDSTFHLIAKRWYGTVSRCAKLRIMQLLWILTEKTTTKVSFSFKINNDETNCYQTVINQLKRFDQLILWSINFLSCFFDHSIKIFSPFLKSQNHKVTK